MKKKIIIIASVIFILVVGSAFSVTRFEHFRDNDITEKYSANKIESDYFTYKNLDELIEKSDVIVIGEVTQNFLDVKPVVKYNDKIDPQYGKILEYFYTTRTIKIDKLIKGSEQSIIFAEDAALISENGEEKLFVSNDATIAKNGVKYLLFLKKGNSIDAYFTTGCIQGKINLEDKNKDLDEKKQDEMNSELAKLKSEAIKKYEKEIKEFV